MDKVELPPFKEAWAKKEAAGYRYGGDALENVAFGYEIARQELKALSRPPAEQVRMREALENIAGHDAGANGLEGFAADLVDQLAATARAALTPPPKGQNDHG